MKDNTLSEIRPEDRPEFWQQEIKNALDGEKDWRQAGRDTIDRYRDIRGVEKSRRGSRFNILWSNVQIQSASALGQLPPPDVRPKYKRGVEGARDVAEALERVMRANVERPDYAEAYYRAVLDDILVSRGVTRPRYRAQIAEVEFNGELAKKMIVGEYIAREHVHWENFTHSPARCWADVWWVGYLHDLTKDDTIEWLAKRLGDERKAKAAFDRLDPPSSSPSNMDVEAHDAVATDRPSSTLSRVQFWEIWSKPEGRVILVGMGGGGEVVDLGEPPIDIEGFFDCGEPLMSSLAPGSLVPVIEYEQYRDQAETLDLITAKIHTLTSMIKVAGLYDSSMGDDISFLSGAPDGTFKSTSRAADLMERPGGLSSGIWMWPFQEAAAALQILKGQQRELINDIYEITGISDIMRGSSEASETLGAQEIKMQTGSLRMANRQRSVQAYIERSYEIDAEIIAEGFQPDVIRKISNIELDQMQIQMMRTQGARQVKITVSTESMAIADKRAQKMEAVEFANSVTPFMERLAAFRQDPTFGPIAVRMLGSIVQAHFPDRDMAELMEKAEEQITADSQQPQEPQVPEALQVAQVREDGAIEREVIKQEGEDRRAGLKAGVEVDKLAAAPLTQNGASQ